jgi:hypothetical protein
VREIRPLRLTWRELETWPGWNCEPTTQSKESGWKPSTCRARASSRPYLRARGAEMPRATHPNPARQAGFCAALPSPVGDSRRRSIERVEYLVFGRRARRDLQSDRRTPMPSSGRSPDESIAGFRLRGGMLG